MAVTLDSYEMKDLGKSAEERKPEENFPRTAAVGATTRASVRGFGPGCRNRTPTGKPPRDFADGKWEAFTRSYNLFLRSVATREEYPLTGDGRTNISILPYSLGADSKKLVADVVKPVE